MGEVFANVGSISCGRWQDEVMSEMEESMIKGRFYRDLNSDQLSMPRWQDEVAEWLRRWTANPLGSARVGSNPILVEPGSMV